MIQQAQEPDPVEGVYRLDRFDVEVRGRWREFGRSLGLFALLLVIQQPLRHEALLPPGDTPYVDPVTSLRISLILDVGFIISYTMLVYRAWGLVRAFHAPRPLASLARFIAYYAVPLLVLLDLVEDVYLWRRYSGDDAVTSLSMGPSQTILTVGVSLSAGITVLLALLTDPRVYWKRRASTIKDRFPRMGHPFGALADEEAMDRWRGTLSSAVDDGSCSCGPWEVPAPTRDPWRDWGVICCSGGGVRSAAFSLGGLQRLNHAGIYRRADAVVGVSGGGYTSTAFHVLRWQSGDTPMTGVEHDRQWTLATRGAFTPQSPELQWLRRHTHYVLDSVRVAIQGALTLAFGIAVNLVLLAIAIGTTAWFLAWLYLASGSITLPTPDHGIEFDAGGDWPMLQWVWVVPLLGLAAFVGERAFDRFHTVPHEARTVARAISTYLLSGGLVLTGLVFGLPALVVGLYDYADSSGSAWAGLIHALGIVPSERCREVLDAGGTAACGVERGLTEGSPAIATASILTIVTSILAVLASVKGASKSSTGTASGFSGFLRKVWDKIKDPIVPWLAVMLILLVLVVALVRWTAILTTRPERLDDWRFALFAAIALAFLKVFSEPNRTSLHHFFRERISYAFLVRRRYQKIRSLPYSEPLRFSRSRPPAGGAGPRLVTCAVANASDPTLIPSQRGCTPFVFDDEAIGLTDRMLPDAAARRGSATYEFAADYGYRDATIPSAVAMSAAAFSPLAGRENVRLGPYRAVLALGNARLGVWLPNPLWVDAGKLARRQATLRDPDFARTWNGLTCADAKAVWEKLGSARPWARMTCEAAEARGPVRHAHLWQRTPPHDVARPFWAPAWEMARTVIKKPGMTRVVREGIGRASIYDRFLYVTDGGHYDNLGLIEALRRRPRRIFVLDASNDPEDTFRALGLAVATARMDLDCELVLDPRPMRRLQEQRSAAAWCTGTATFPDGTTCSVYLVKAIMIDNMSWDVETYAASNLDFPRTSTGKQLYSEFDFEAYRILGSRAVEELLASPEYLRREAAIAADERAAADAALAEVIERLQAAEARVEAATEEERPAAVTLFTEALGDKTVSERRARLARLAASAAQEAAYG
ncbi:MAG: hypothetical protein ABWX84_05140 [Nocardioides sp.]